MKHKILAILLIIVASLLFFNCSEIKDDIAPPPILEGVHPDGFGKLGSENFHNFYIQDHNWDLESCQKCHAADYSGGIAGVSCLNCHTESAGPEACNTCHGVFADESRIAPPTDLNNNYETTAKGVGAHTSHVYENDLSLVLSCNECHPGNPTGSVDFVKTHINGLPAEIEFGTLASSGATAPSYNSDFTCSNTYCHGGFEFKKEESQYPHAYTESTITGNNFSPLWTKVDGTQAECGTCHGKIDDNGNLITPQPNGHFSSFTIDECVLCHATAFNEDGSLNKSTHMNGEKNLN